MRGLATSLVVGPGSRDDRTRAVRQHQQHSMLALKLSAPKDLERTSLEGMPAPADGHFFRIAEKRVIVLQVGIVLVLLGAR